VTAAASLSLGYRGESALVHGIALLIAIALFLAEVVGSLIVAALADSRKHKGPPASCDAGGPSKPQLQAAAGERRS
jgi:hypothetical protein